MKETLAYGYARVSTDEQGREGFSIEKQIDEINREANKQNIKIVKIFVDDGYSASNVKRPAFQELLSCISKKGNNAKIIVVRDSSRIIRNLTLKRSIKKVFNKYDIKILYTSYNIDDTTPEGELQADFVALIDESEIKRISPRTVKGLQGSALLGNYPYGGKRAPRGYKRVENTKAGKGKKLVHNEEAEWIIKIFEMLATNRITAVSLISLLKKEKVFGIKWYRDTLYDIIDNPIYYGRLVTNWFDSEDSNIDEYYKKTFWYDIDHHTEPLISKELWEKVQKIVHNKKYKYKHDYIFSRLVYCTDNEMYLVNEPAWKTKKNGERVLYKYYASSQLKKRINENRILEKFANEYKSKSLTKVNQKIYINLNNKLNNLFKRRNILNDEFDNGFLDEEDFQNMIRELNISILETKKKIKSLEETSEDFLSLPYTKQRAIVLSNIERINISFEKDSIEIIYLN